MVFNDWITKKYVEWRGDAVGRDRTISEFAAWVGVPQSVMSSWMQPNGKIPTSQRSIRLLVSKYGTEVYEALGLEVIQDNQEIETIEDLSHFIREHFPGYELVRKRPTDDRRDKP